MCLENIHGIVDIVKLLQPIFDVSGQLFAVCHSRCHVVEFRILFELRMSDDITEGFPNFFADGCHNRALSVLAVVKSVW